MQKRILIVDDEPAIRDMVAFALRKGDYDPVHAGDAREASAAIADRVPDLILLDWMLPGSSGLELARRWRRDDLTRDVPIIMLTARGEEPDRLRGLDTGADDFISKPFSPAELIARVRAVLRRVRPAFAEQVLTFHDLRLDLAAHRVFRCEREIHLSPTEFRLLRYFLENPSRVFSRAQLLDRVWGSDLEIELRTVDATVRRLRRALNAGGEGDLLRTVRAEGYSLDHKLAGPPSAERTVDEQDHRAIGT